MLFGTLFTIEQATMGVVERFGKFNRLAPAGLHLKIPVFDKVRGRINLRIRQLNVKVDTKTKDNVFVDIIVSVQFHVIPGQEFTAFYSLTNVEQQLTAYVFNSVRSRVPALDLDHVFERKQDIEDSVMEELSSKVASYGYSIDAAPITDVQPNNKVRDAMNEINASKRLQEAAEFQGNANRIKVVKAAEAEKESKRLQGEGIAAERIAITEGIKTSLAMLVEASGESSAEVMRTLALVQYFDTLKAIGMQGKSTVFVPHSPGGLADLQSQIAQAVMAAKASDAP